MPDNDDHSLDIEEEKEATEQTAPFEHCPDCGTRTGGGRCGFCRELSFDWGESQCHR
jgi:predicted RNA-binding Zn-ribbon protein involved in translation (DUF1610 family)